jgi:hypothetical protein
MELLKYIGEAKNIGRFGWVQPGTTLILTDKEADGVRDNKDFVPETDPENQGLSTAQIERENNHDRILALELQDKTAAELVEIIEEMKVDGYHFEPIPKHATRQELIFAINKAEEIQAKAAVETVQEEPQEPQPPAPQPVEPKPEQPKPTTKAKRK